MVRLACGIEESVEWNGKWFGARNGMSFHSLDEGEDGMEFTQ